MTLTLENQNLWDFYCAELKDTTATASADNSRLAEAANTDARSEGNNEDDENKENSKESSGMELWQALPPKHEKFWRAQQMQGSTKRCGGGKSRFKTLLVSKATHVACGLPLVSISVAAEVWYRVFIAQSIFAGEPATGTCFPVSNRRLLFVSMKLLCLISTLRAHSSNQTFGEQQLDFGRITLVTSCDQLSLESHRIKCMTVIRVSFSFWQLVEQYTRPEEQRVPFLPASVHQPKLGCLSALWLFRLVSCIRDSTTDHPLCRYKLHSHCLACRSHPARSADCGTHNQVWVRKVRYRRKLSHSLSKCSSHRRTLPSKWKSRWLWEILCRTGNWIPIPWVDRPFPYRSRIPTCRRIFCNPLQLWNSPLRCAIHHYGYIALLKAENVERLQGKS